MKALLNVSDSSELSQLHSLRHYHQWEVHFHLVEEIYILKPAF
jgi:hypothetical protein